MTICLQMPYNIINLIFREYNFQKCIFKYVKYANLLSGQFLQEVTFFYSFNLRAGCNFRRFRDCISRFEIRSPEGHSDDGHPGFGRLGSDRFF